MNSKQTILIVDDTAENLEILSGILRPYYKVVAALDGESALEIVLKDPKPDMILLDVMMPGINGYEVCERLKSHPATVNIPVIFVTAMNEVKDEKFGFELGAVDYVTKPINPSVVLARIKTHLALYDQNRELEKKVQERTKEIEETRLEIIRKLGRAAEYKDNETGLHVIRMSHYSRLLAEAVVGGANEWTNLVFQAAPMHDIGKIGIPDHILLKPGKLDPEEWTLMQCHAQFGADILGDHHSELLQTARQIAICHHEKWDGTGYPNGLRGNEIPIEARIVAIADVFDALTSERPYKRAWDVEEALSYIYDNSGLHFDPGLVEHLKNLISEFLKIKDEFDEDSHPSMRG
jgi:putative two-component system response regulator